MGAPQYEQAGADIGGTGTTNTIPRWTGASTLGDSGLIDDSTSIYTSTRRVGVDTSTTLANVKFQVGSASALSNYQGAPFGVILPAGSGSWLEFAENSTNGTAFRITKDSNTGVILNANGKDVGFDAGAYESLISGCQMVLKTSGNVGIGTASPTATSTIYKANNSLGAWNAQDLSVDGLSNGDAVYQRWYATGVAGAVGRFGVTFQSSVASFVWNSLFNSGVQTAELMRLTGGGNLGIGTASPGRKLEISASAPLRMGTGGEYFDFLQYTPGTWAWLSSAGQYVASWKTSGGVGFGGIVAPASNTVDVSTAGWGLKLPATPGNGNANTLDSYQEGTRVLSAGDLSGWTYVTATQYWTLVGRTVTLHTVFTGGTSSATGGATIATPPLLTPLRIAAGAAVNSSGTALGNGVCVVASTSSTTGTVITSNAISSSAVDKVLTVTYETAGL